MRRHKLQVVEPIEGDIALSREHLERLERFSPDDTLVCGDCSGTILTHFSVEEAQHCFVGKTGRTLAQCEACLAYNLLSTKFLKS